ncbi:MAG: hypothetical protein WDW38_001862 [Sanguina aurantia]
MLCLGLYVDKLSVVYLFQWQQMSVHSGLGWLSILANLATSVAGAMFLMWIVERAKKCLDFASTMYLLHLIMCCSVSGFPASLECSNGGRQSSTQMSLLNGTAKSTLSSGRSIDLPV